MTVSGQIMPTARCLACRQEIEGDYVMVVHGFKREDEGWNYYLCEPCAEESKARDTRRGDAAQTERMKARFER